MLQTQTVEPGTFALLKQLMDIPALAKFSLVGGTALSLKYGHRISVDIDLFCEQGFERDTILNDLQSFFGKDFVYDGKITNWAIFGFIHDIKVDIVHYTHPMIAEKELIDGIRMYNTKDIIARKINAILGRGVKKDFWDIYELLQHYSIEQLIDYHSRKFPSQQLMITIPQALVYFEDAEQSPEPISLKGQTWDEVKNFIRKQVNIYLQ
ncbi:MAG: nucleotidyl transferase AbiEii/AbiGii toxin family protein [Sediminibacterium sp.]